MTDPQSITKDVYEDTSVVHDYVKKHSINPALKEIIEKKFAPLVKPAGKVLDLGCGPGHDSQILFDLGFEVIGLDYSQQMIKKAKDLYRESNKLKFIVADMRKLSKLFDENSFDGVWAAASIIHLPREEVKSVLVNLSKIVKNEGIIFFGLKEGDGEELKTDNERYGNKQIQRFFTYWDKDEFTSLAQQTNMKLIDYSQFISSPDQKNKTRWARLFYKVQK